MAQRHTIRYIYAGLGGSVAFAAASIVSAQQGTSFETAIPEFEVKDSSVLEGKAFLARFNFEGGATSYSNVFREEADEDSDVGVFLNPELTLSTNGESAFSGVVQFEIEHLAFQEFDFNDQTSWELGGRGSYEFSDQNEGFSRLRFGKREIGIGGFDDLDADEDTANGGASEPTEYTYTDFEGRFDHLNDRFYAGAGVEFQTLDYDDAVRFDDGSSDDPDRLIIDNDDRDRTDTSVFARAGRVLGDRKFGLVGGIRQIDYDEMVDSTEVVGRNADGYVIAAEYEVGNRASRHNLIASAGVESRSFDAAEYDDLTTLIFDVVSRSDLTPRADLTVRLTRNLEEVTLRDTSVAIETDARADLRYTVAPNLRLRGGARFENTSFEVNTDLNDRDEREDDRFFLRGEAEYEVRDAIWAFAGADVTQRTSTQDSAEYDEVRFSIGLRTDY